MIVNFTLNKEKVSMDVPLTKRLIDVIREEFDLTGTKEGCGEGECGACMVFIDEEVYNSCLIPMGNVEGKEIITIDYFATTDRYKKIETALIDAGGVQCGFCTPGMVMAIDYLIRTNTKPTEKEIRFALSGNLCRCTGYQSIFEAVNMILR